MHLHVMLMFRLDNLCGVSTHGTQKPGEASLLCNLFLGSMLWYSRPPSTARWHLGACFYLQDIISQAQCHAHPELYLARYKHKQKCSYAFGKLVATIQGGCATAHNTNVCGCRHQQAASTDMWHCLQLLKTLKLESAHFLASWRCTVLTAN